MNNNDQGTTTHNNRVPSHKSGLKVDTPPWAHLACPPPRFSSSRIPSKSPLCVCEGALCNFMLPTPANDMPQSSSSSNEARSRLHNSHIEPPTGLVVVAGLVAVAGQARHILDFIRRRQLHTTTPQLLHGRGAYQPRLKLESAPLGTLAALAPTLLSSLR
jgi:hypothetical protein